MPYHHFKLFQIVACRSDNFPPGPYKILRVLPLVGSEPQYLVKSMIDERERVLMEQQIAAISPRCGKRDRG